MAKKAFLRSLHWVWYGSAQYAEVWDADSQINWNIWAQLSATINVQKYICAKVPARGGSCIGVRRYCPDRVWHWLSAPLDLLLHMAELCFFSNSITLCFFSNSIALCYFSNFYCIVLSCITNHCTVISCITNHCIVLQFGWSLRLECTNLVYPLQFPNRALFCSENAEIWYLISNLQ